MYSIREPPGSSSTMRAAHATAATAAARGVTRTAPSAAARLNTAAARINGRGAQSSSKSPSKRTATNGRMANGRDLERTDNPTGVAPFRKEMVSHSALMQRYHKEMGPTAKPHISMFLQEIVRKTHCNEMVDPTLIERVRGFVKKQNANTTNHNRRMINVLAESLCFQAEHHNATLGAAATAASGSKAVANGKSSLVEDFPLFAPSPDEEREEPVDYHAANWTVDCDELPRLQICEEDEEEQLLQPSWIFTERELMKMKERNDANGALVPKAEPQEEEEMTEEEWIKSVAAPKAACISAKFNNIICGICWMELHGKKQFAAHVLAEHPQRKQKKADLGKPTTSAATAANAPAAQPQQPSQQQVPTTSSGVKETAKTVPVRPADVTMAVNETPKVKIVVKEEPVDAIEQQPPPVPTAPHNPAATTEQVAAAALTDPTSPQQIPVAVKLEPIDEPAEELQPQSTPAANIAAPINMSPLAALPAEVKQEPMEESARPPSVILNGFKNDNKKKRAVQPNLTVQNEQSTSPLPPAVVVKTEPMEESGVSPLPSSLAKPSNIVNPSVTAPQSSSKPTSVVLPQKPETSGCRPNAVDATSLLIEKARQRIQALQKSSHPNLTPSGDASSEPQESSNDVVPTQSTPRKRGRPSTKGVAAAQASAMKTPSKKESVATLVKNQKPTTSAEKKEATNPSEEMLLCSKRTDASPVKSLKNGERIKRNRSSMGEESPEREKKEKFAATPKKTSKSMVTRRSRRMSRADGDGDESQDEDDESGSSGQKKGKKTPSSQMNDVIKTEMEEKKGLYSKEALTCPFCEETATSVNWIDRHVRKQHKCERTEMYSCTECSKPFRVIASAVSHWFRDGKCPEGRLAVVEQKKVAPEKSTSSEKTSPPKKPAPKVDEDVKEEQPAPVTSLVAQRGKRTITRTESFKEFMTAVKKRKTL